MNLITKLFKKKEKTPQQKIKKPIDNKKPFNFEKHKANLQAFYDCSVQKTALDFRIEQVDINGQTVNVAMDSFEGCSDIKGIQQLYQPNFAGEEIIFTHFAANGFIGFNNCAILAQDWLINKCLSLPCEDAISINYDITLQDIKDEDKDIISDLKKVSEDDGKYKIKKICHEFAENKRKFGQALCIPLVEGADYSVPFNIDAIKPKSYKGMVNIEPIWVTPVLDIESTTNPLSERFYKPTWFRMPDGTNVHYTWFLFNTYGDIPDILKPTYYFGGYPLPQQLYQQVYAAHKTAKEAPMLAQSKRLNYVEGNLNAFLADEEKLSREVNLMSWLRNNWGWLLIKKDQKIGQLDTSLTDFDAVTMLGYQIVSAISYVPSARLLETSPKGWQSTGSYEDNNYKKLQQAIQRLDYCPILDFHYRLLAKSKYDIDKHYSCVFDEIDTPTEKERAEIRELNSRTDMNYINAGVVSPEEVRDVIRADEKSGYDSLSEEMEGEALNEGEDPFSDLLGGSSNEEAPFSQDEWEESKHPRDKDGKFASSGSTTSSSAISSSNSKTIAGVRQGKPMQFKQANEGRVNPNYKKGGGYQTNCQACIAVFEARMRGYNIEALPKISDSHKELAYKPNMAYQDPKTGESPPFIKSNVRNGKECKKWLNEQVKPGERYAFAYSPEMTIGETGHIIEVIKTEDNKLIFYDPQKGKTYNESFLDDIGYETPFGNLTICYSPMIFRIDDKELNLEILNNISTISKDIIEK